MSKADDALTYARTEVGKPYTYGAEGPNAFDCSGLVQWVFAHVGISLPRTAAAQQAATKAVANPRPGDLVFYGQPAHHVAIYLGGGKQIAAPHTGAKVQVQDVYSGVSNYGRVAGLGIASTVLGTVTSANNALFSGDLSGVADSIVGGVKETATKVTFGVLGLALVGFGIYKTLGPKISSTVNGALK